MQTFLPYPSFRASAAVLDDRRLGKQRVEAFQILRALTVPGYGWQHHPAVRMWRGFLPALAAYAHAVTDEWIRRGREDTVRGQLLPFTGGQAPDVRALAARGMLPPWLGRADVHHSHREALRRKDPDFYAEAFAAEPDEAVDATGTAIAGYVWPRPPFPRWPLIRFPGDVAAAAGWLGVPTLRAEQAAALDAVLAGRDALAPIPPGAGRSTTGLLAGLVTAGRTLWVTPCCPTLAEADGAVSEADYPGVLASAPMDDDSGFAFLAAGQLTKPAAREVLTARPVGLVVVDDADRLDARGDVAVRSAASALGGAPVLRLGEHPAGEPG